MGKAFVFFADGLEEVEAIAPVDLLRRAGNSVTTVSIMGRKEVRGAHDIQIQADALFENIDFSEGDLFVLPGGSEGTEHLGEFEPLLSVLREKQASGKRIAAICAAPSILADLGFLSGKQATIYPAMAEALGDALYQDVPAVTDGLFTTGHGPGAAMHFGLELVRLLNGEEVAHSLQQEFVFPYA